MKPRLNEDWLAVWLGLFLFALSARFVKGFTAVFCAAYLSWIVGSWAYIAATPDKRAAFHIGWSLNLTNEAGYIVALIAGLLVGNFFPGLAAAMKEAIRPELVWVNQVLFHT